MAVRCKNCGGTCVKNKNGDFVCQCCGSVKDEQEFAPVKNQSPAGAGNGADVFEKNVGGTLEINCQGEDGTWSGSGYLFSREGYAITNAHVAAEGSTGRPCSKMTVTVLGQTIPARVIGLADDRAGHGNGVDLAIIQLSSFPRGGTALKLADETSIRNGEQVFVIGNSLGAGTCITSGIVSDRAREIDGKTFIMTDCAVNPGNSGGPIFNKNGEVIGTITLQGRTHTGADAEGMNYAIPIDVVKKFIAAAEREMKIRF